MSNIKKTISIFGAFALLSISNISAFAQSSAASSVAVPASINMNDPAGNWLGQIFIAGSQLIINTFAPLILIGTLSAWILALMCIAGKSVLIKIFGGKEKKETYDIVAKIKDVSWHFGVATAVICLVWILSGMMLVVLNIITKGFATTFEPVVKLLNDLQTIFRR